MKNNKPTVPTDNPQYETKAKKNFTLRIALGLIIGAICGFATGVGTDLLGEQLSGTVKAILQKIPAIQIFIFPWIMLLLIIIFTAINESLLKKSRKQIDSWDGEDDEHIRIADGYLDRVCSSTSIELIIFQLLFAIVTYNLIKNLSSTTSIVMVSSAIAIYFANFFIITSHQRRTIALIKEYAPEKQGSVYDKKFQDVWLASCDEAERYILYEICYKTFQFMNKIFSIFLTTSILIGMFIPIGLLCSFVIGLLWLIMTWHYAKEAVKINNP